MVAKPWPARRHLTLATHDTLADAAHRMAAPAGAPRGRRKRASSVGVDVADVRVRSAIERILRSAGWTVGRATALRVTDSAITTAPAAVAVVPPNPATCDAAVNRTISGALLGAVLVDELDHLPNLVEAVRRGLTALSPRVLGLAADAPRLTARQLEVLRNLLCQRTNVEIATALRVSEATVKRELTEIGKALGAAKRSGIATAAYALGFRPGDASSTHS